MPIAFLEFRPHLSSMWCESTSNTLKTRSKCQLKVRECCLLIVQAHKGSKGVKTQPLSFLTSVSRRSLVSHGGNPHKPPANFCRDVINHYVFDFSWSATDVTNLNEPPSSFLLPPHYCGLGAGSIPLRAIVNKKQCETRRLITSLVIHCWMGDVQDSQGVSVSQNANYHF